MSDDELRAEIVALRNKLAELERRLEPGPTAPGRRVSRRGLLAAAVAGGAGLVATQVTTAAPAAAAPGNAVVLGAVNDGGGAITTVRSGTGLNSSPFAVVNDNPNGNSIGLYGRLGSASQVFDGSVGQRAAVMGDSQDDSGVSGISRNGAGVYGQSDANPGVFARSRQYMAVRAESDEYIGVFGAGYGDAQSVGVAGTSPTGTGVTANSTSGTALDAASDSGYGVQARGGRAPLRLLPGATTGKPTKGTHRAGEFYVDKIGDLFCCRNSGTPGVWKKVTL